VERARPHCGTAGLGWQFSTGVIAFYEKVIKVKADVAAFLS